MSLPRKLIGYVQADGRSRKQKAVAQEQQIAWIQARADEHPNGQLADIHVESGPGSESLKKALKACLNRQATLLVCYNLRDKEFIREAIHDDDIEVVLVHPPGQSPEHHPGCIAAQPRDFGLGPITRAAVQPKLDDLWKTIERECGCYLAAVRETGRLLFRGMTTRSADAYFALPRDDRKPRDTPSEFHVAATKLMAAKGFRANRNNSIFATGDAEFAEQFAEEKILLADLDTPTPPARGRIYAIFPSDGFAFSWSRNFRDFGGVLHARDYSRATVMQDEVPHLAWRADFASWDFDNALMSGHEVLLSGPYYAILWRDFSGVTNELGLPRGFHTQVQDRIGTKIVAKPFAADWIRRRAVDNEIQSDQVKPFKKRAALKTKELTDVG